MNLLYFSPSSYGGLADYAHAQAQALSEEGVEVTLLCGPDFPDYPKASYIRAPRLLVHRSTPASTRLGRASHMAKLVIENHSRLAEEIKKQKYASVLFGSFAEYFAPIWAPRLKRLKGIRWGAIIHDPVRDAVMGPAWWHKYSIAEAYSFLDLAFVHENTSLQTEGKRAAPQTVVIPHGPYSFPYPKMNQAQARRHLNIPDNVPVLLVFGHIRDGKNLELVVDVLSEFPGVHLLIAGKEQSGSQRPAGYYQNHARLKKVSERCHWFISHIPDEDVGIYFTAANYLLLPYNNTFRSASGVLNAAVQFRTPCLATSGPGPLCSAVMNYNLGIWRPADDKQAFQEGLQTLINKTPSPQWDRYLRDNDWQINARTVKQSFLSN